MIKSKYIKKVPDGKGGYLYFYGGERIPTAHTKPHREAVMAGDKATTISKPSKRHHHKAAQANEKARTYYAGVQSQHSDLAQQAHADGAHERAEIHADMSKIYGQLSDHHHDESKRHHGHIRKLIDRKPTKQEGLPGYLATVKAKGIIMLKAKYIRKVPDGEGGWRYVYERPGKGEVRKISAEERVNELRAQSQPSHYTHKELDDKGEERHVHTNIVTKKQVQVPESTHKLHTKASDVGVKAHRLTNEKRGSKDEQLVAHEKAEAIHDKAAKYFTDLHTKERNEASKLEAKGEKEKAEKKWDTFYAHHQLSIHHMARRDQHTSAYDKVSRKKAEKTGARKGVILLKAKYIKRVMRGGKWVYTYTEPAKKEAVPGTEEVRTETARRSKVQGAVEAANDSRKNAHEYGTHDLHTSAAQAHWLAAKIAAKHGESGIEEKLNKRADQHYEDARKLKTLDKEREYFEEVGEPALRKGHKELESALSKLKTAKEKDLSQSHADVISAAEKLRQTNNVFHGELSRAIEGMGPRFSQQKLGKARAQIRMHKEVKKELSGIIKHHRDEREKLRLKGRERQAA